MEYLSCSERSAWPSTISVQSSSRLQRAEEVNIIYRDALELFHKFNDETFSWVFRLMKIRLTFLNLVFGWVGTYRQMLQLNRMDEDNIFCMIWMMIWMMIFMVIWMMMMIETFGMPSREQESSWVTRSSIFWSCYHDNHHRHDHQDNDIGKSS